jgi:4-alpha-glucanotransferase
MIEAGWLSHEEIEPIPRFTQNGVDFKSVFLYKSEIFMKAHERFKMKEEKNEYEQFCYQNRYWIDDFALFIALKSHFQGKPWSDWPEEFRDRKPDALVSAGRTLQDEMDRVKFLQFLFFKQWMDLKRYCNDRGIQIIGDIPIYVNYDSADLWVHAEIFKLDALKRPCVVAGVPPDYFSETGQLWGNPIYDWDALKANNYDWWIHRIAHNLNLFDIVRLDHFRGMVAYWEVPAHEQTAINGRWVEAPAVDFFNMLLREFPNAPIIAEDLGTITPEVREIMQRFNFPGMKLLLFAFGADLPSNPYVPHNLVKNCVAYTGTHDNNTTRGWFEKEATSEIKKRLFSYLGRVVTNTEVSWEMVRLAMMSVANTAIFPMQDILGLGEEARMNRPAVRDGNWQWRVLPEHLNSALAHRLREMTQTYGRIQSIAKAHNARRSFA